MRGCGAAELVVEVTGETSYIAWPVAAITCLSSAAEVVLSPSSGVVESEGTRLAWDWVTFRSVDDTDLMTDWRAKPWLTAVRGLASSMEDVGTRPGGDLRTVNTGARRGWEIQVGEDMIWYIIGWQTEVVVPVEGAVTVVPGKIKGLPSRVEGRPPMVLAKVAAELTGSKGLRSQSGLLSRDLVAEE